MQTNKKRQQQIIWDQTYFFWEYLAKRPVNGRNEVLTKVIWVYVTWHTGLHTEMYAAMFKVMFCRDQE